MAIQDSNTIANWNLTQLIRFIQDILDGRPSLNVQQLTADEVVVVKSLIVRGALAFPHVNWRSLGGTGNPAFTNGWVPSTGANAPPGFWKDLFDFVHLRGNIKSGTLNTPAWTQPPGARPAYQQTFSTVSNGALGVLQVNADGTVVPVSGSNLSFSLDGIRFRVT